MCHIASCAEQWGLNVDHAPLDIDMTPCVQRSIDADGDGELTKESVVLGHHVYKEVWRPVVGIKRLLSRVYAEIIQEESMCLIGRVH